MKTKKNRHRVYAKHKKHNIIGIEECHVTLHISDYFEIYHIV